jgi:hypothetical protein
MPISRLALSQVGVPRFELNDEGMAYESSQWVKGFLQGLNLKAL